MKKPIISASLPYDPTRVRIVPGVEATVLPSGEVLTDADLVARLRAEIGVLRAAADAMHAEITEQLDEYHDQGCQSEDAQIERDAHADPEAEQYGDECSRCGFMRVVDAYQAALRGAR
jgi:hypothetical protein